MFVPERGDTRLTFQLKKQKNLNCTFILFV